MKRKKNRGIKVLVGALLLALVITVPSYAWIYFENMATMRGVTMKLAKTEKEPELMLYFEGQKGNTVSLNMEALSMKAGTSVDGNNMYTILDASKPLETGNYETVADSNTTYWVRKNICAYMSAGNAKLRVSNITVTGDDEINKAIRVAVLFEGERFLYAPVSGADSQYTSIGGATVKPMTTYEKAFTNSMTTVQKDAIIAIWFEGQDSHFNYENALLADDTVTVEIEFTAE